MYMRHSDSLNFPESSNERSTPRERIDCAATFRELGSTVVPVQMVDLTSAGCRVRGCQTRRAEEVWLRIGGFQPMRAYVIWAKGSEAGCKFYQPLRPNELRAIRQAR